MTMCKHNNRMIGKKAQAMVELAVFGSIILVVFGVLLSFLQQFNNQQYVQMEAFRRGLEKACNHIPSSGKGAGASVQYTMMQTRRTVDMSGPFRKGSPNTVNASVNVYWAIPEIEKDVEPDSLIVMRINEDERVARYRDFVPRPPKNEEGEYPDDTESFRTEEIKTSYKNTFADTSAKTETLGGIVNVKSSKMTETIKTTIPYVITKKEEPDDYDDSNDVILKEGTFWEVEQGLYLDTDGQYKYTSEQAGSEIERSRTWQTAF